MFEIEALKGSREFSEARFGDVRIVQGASIGKLSAVNYDPTVWSRSFWNYLIGSTSGRFRAIRRFPCNHICVCADCVEELLEIYEEPLCSLCRSIISSYVDVYI
ncbi:Zinc finger C3HC4 type (RING finger) family protein [Brugia pahangi]